MSVSKSRTRKSPPKYSVEEIDQMRSAIKCARLRSGHYDPIRENAAIEGQLRTHMQNGTTVAELEQAASRHMDALHKYNMSQRKVVGDIMSADEVRAVENIPPPPIPAPLPVDQGTVHNTEASVFWPVLIISIVAVVLPLLIYWMANQ